MIVASLLAPAANRMKFSNKSMNCRLSQTIFSSASIGKVTAVRMFNYIQAEWEAQIAALEAELGSIADYQERLQREAKIAWMRETEMAVVVSDEQNEIKKFKDWGLDIIPHRKRVKDGFYG